MRRKSDLPLYIGIIHDFYFDTTPYTLNDNVNTKSVRLNDLIDVCLQYCIENDLNYVSNSTLVRSKQR